MPEASFLNQSWGGAGPDRATALVLRGAPAVGGILQPAPQPLQGSVAPSAVHLTGGGEQFSDAWSTARGLCIPAWD